MDSAPPFKAAFLHPRYWPTWLAIGLLWLLCWLPVPAIVGFGKGLGWLFGKLAKSRRHVVRVNLKLCFPRLDAAAREKLVNEHFMALGAGIFEAGLAWFAPDWRLRGRGEVVGLEHLDAAMQDGHGVLLLTGHFTTLEMGARYLCLADRPFHAMYRPINNPLIDYFMHRWREARSGLPALPKNDLKKLVRALRQGHCIWYGPDQSLDVRNAIHVPFFGVPTLTLTATSKLAQMGRARVVPYFPARINGRYRVTFLPALENFPTDDEAADAAMINRMLEAGINIAPAQYFWSHRRFKHPPAGMPDPYRN
ncbi:MAG TPA: LpxL/LpxP family Kdo(2)-lipid IV(A) lauroyl/palmitoleoyl acyltransferase [Stenotrophobium sp.]|jgi:KDO2-lipid IV(A) lauroyltransferase|nr:LpxL/LpxP family Kdo(2)-lipid IV(A) lauroyl/palmitoleoyl acyltransferase [Stenotrophobium sp.]